MKFFPILLIIFGIIIVTVPEILAYLLGGFFIFIGFNLLFFSKIFSKKSQDGQNYVKFGKYKIFR